MANYTLDQTQQDYYDGGDFGGYQYVALSDVIDNSLDDLFNRGTSLDELDDEMM